MIRVGPAGWSYADWEGIVYPRPRPKGFHPLAHLLPFVDCVEVNGTFYGLPRAEYVARWAEIVGEKEGFQLLAKLHQEFTHAPPLSESSFAARASAFLAGLDPLVRSGRFGALLLQFPLGFTRNRANEERLDRLAEAFGHLPLAVELRHRSWFEPPILADLRRREMSLLHIDLPAAADHPPDWFESTGPIGYLRLHGRNAATWFARGVGRDQRYDYLYPPAELDTLVEKAQRLAREHDETYVITNNHFEGQAVANALEIRARLAGAPVAAPATLVARYPHLDGCTRVSGQQSLF